MQLNEILEEHTLRAICKRTNISENNLEMLISEDFYGLSKSKALGFISIIEREYHADLSDLKEKAKIYYNEHVDNRSSLGLDYPTVEDKTTGSRPKWFLLLMLGLLAYASWYFFTQFDKKTLNTLFPFKEDKSDMNFSIDTQSNQNKEKIDKDLMITKDLITPQPNKTSSNIFNTSKKPLIATKKNTSIKRDMFTTPEENNKIETAVSTTTTVSNKRTMDNSLFNTTSEVSQSHLNSNTTTVPSSSRTTHTLTRVKNVSLVPERKLWFGLVDLETGKRKHMSISNKYEMNVIEKSWLVATSPASFSLINKDKVQEFNDAKRHYFKISKDGIEELSKKEYVAQGGYRRW